MSNTNRSVLKTTLALVASSLIIFAAAWLFLNRQFVLDTYTNYTFSPSAEIAAIGESTHLTDDGRFTFYATRPEILSADSFNQVCPRQEVGSPILGCYTPDDRIYVYNVTSADLEGMKEVTAVHELLHAFWFRMSESERDKLEVQLVDAYEKNADDAFKTRMEYYERTEPGQFVNELYAILGTEIDALGDELENHYSQYFDREVVLGLHDQYSSTYDQLISRSTELASQMQTLSASIDTASEAYTANAQTFANDVESFNNRASNGSFSSRAQFNNERAALVARSNQLDADRQALNAMIETHNTYYKEYQQISTQIETLNNSMDSYPTIEEAPSI